MSASTADIAVALAMGSLIVLCLVLAAAFPTPPSAWDVLGVAP